MSYRPSQQEKEGFWKSEGCCLTESWHSQSREGFALKRIIVVTLVGGREKAPVQNALESFNKMLCCSPWAHPTIQACRDWLQFSPQPLLLRCWGYLRAQEDWAQAMRPSKTRPRRWEQGVARVLGKEHLATHAYRNLHATDLIPRT